MQTSPISESVPTDYYSIIRLERFEDKAFKKIVYMPVLDIKTRSKEIIFKRTTYKEALENYECEVYFPIFESTFNEIKSKFKKTDEDSINLLKNSIFTNTETNQKDFRAFIYEIMNPSDFY